MGLKSTVKKAVLAPLSKANVFGAARGFYGCRGVILCYHRVIDGPLDLHQPGMVVSKATFERHLEWMARKFEVVDLTDMARAYLTGEKPRVRARPKAVVTFDDGWLDNYEVAFPIMKRMGIPAIIFLPTGFIGTNGSYWNARATAALVRIHRKRAELVRAFPDEHMPPEADFLTGLLALELPVPVLIDRVVNAVKILPQDAIDRITDFLVFLADGEGERTRTILDWPEVKEMDSAGIGFGSHSVKHRIMTKLSASECYQEAVESMKVMTEVLGKPPQCFAYPNGDHNETAVREVRRAGYLCACTVQGGFVERAGDLFTLPRFSLHEGGAPNEAALDFLLSGLVAR